MSRWTVAYMFGYGVLLGVNVGRADWPMIALLVPMGALTYWFSTDADEKEARVKEIRKEVWLERLNDR